MAGACWNIQMKSSTSSGKIRKTSTSLSCYVDENHASDTSTTFKPNTFLAPIVVHNSQQRGFTYVTDIVEGQILAAEKIADRTAVNLGWDKRYKIKDVVNMTLDAVGYRPAVVYEKTKPEGPFGRALDVSLANRLLGWRRRSTCTKD